MTNYPIHQVISRIFYFFLKNVLNYTNVHLIPIETTFNEWEIFENIRYLIYPIFNILKLFFLINCLRRNATKPTISIINMYVRMNYSEKLPEKVSFAGHSIGPGHYGWIVPISNIWIDNLTHQSLSFNIFKNISNTHYDQYVIDKNKLKELTHFPW